MILPQYIDIELNTSCNLKCDPCPYKQTHKKPEFMELDLYKKIIDQIDWDASIKLCQRGEPLLSPILEEAIEYANKKGLRTVINTNGLMLDKFKSKQLIEAGLEALILSDYGVESQYRNGCIFSGMNQAYKKPIHFIVKSMNVKRWEGIADEVREHIYYDYSSKEDDHTELHDWVCDFLFERLIIEPTGIIRCCCGSIHPQKFIGHIDTGLKNIWISSILNHYRDIHSRGNSHKLEMCRHCGYRKASGISKKN